MFNVDFAIVFHTIVLGICAYIALICILRISGSRTLSKMNAFDFVVTITIGSVFASVLTNQNVSLVQGIAAFATLVGLQFIVTWLSVRAPWVRKLVTGEPKLLYFKGQYQAEIMQKTRVTADEVQAAMRVAGRSTHEVDAVTLETNGTLSVTSKINTSRHEKVQALQRETTIR